MAFTIICIHPIVGCKYLKILKEGEYYFFNDWYREENGHIIRNEDNIFKKGFFGNGITIQAVVGKNGSGKSSLLELIYRILNNFSYVTTEGVYRAKAERLYYIKGIKAELYFELDGQLGCVKVEDDTVTFVYGENNPLKLYFPGSKNYEETDGWLNARPLDGFDHDAIRGMERRTIGGVGPELRPITSEYLDYDEVMHKYDQMMDWLAELYVNTLNVIQYMHDKYYYEAAEMALLDTHVRRTFATGIAGFSHVVDSLSAIKYAKVKTVRDETGIVVDYITEGDFPRYGNDDDRADDIAVWLLGTFLSKIKKHHTYRDSEPTTSILTITSNVVYGKATGSMPDGRKAGEPLAPGANPAYGAEQNGLLASLNSVAKLPYEWALDGISNTQTINPEALGHSEQEQADNLVRVMDGYFDQGAHHLNVNVFGREKLIDAMEHPEKEEYQNFTIRVSGYAVKFIDLTREQQLDVISRTCHDRM